MKQAHSYNEFEWPFDLFRKLGGVTDQEDIEVPRQILETSARLFIAHIRAIPREQNVTDAVFL